MQECTFKPKLYWGRKLGRKRRTPGASSKENKETPETRRGHRSLSPRRKLFEPLSPQRKPISRPRPVKMTPKPLLPAPREDPIPNLSPSPIDKKDESSCGSLSLLRRHHSMMRERNERSNSPVPPLPLEIITRGIVPVSPVAKNRPWQTALYTRDGSISPLRDGVFGIEIDDEAREPTLAPRIVFCGTTVGGESEAAQTQATEYGSI